MTNELILFIYFFISGENEKSLIHIFSMVHHTRKLFTVKKPLQDDGLFVFHGIKMLAIAAVYVTHKYLSILWLSTSHQICENAKTNNLGYSMAQLTDLACDVFFFISGAIVAYSFYKAKDKRMPNAGFLIFMRFIR